MTAEDLRPSSLAGPLGAGEGQRSGDPARLPEIVYTPASQLLRPVVLLRAMAKDLLASRDLAWRLFVRNVSARYRQTVLGYVWAILPPAVATGLFVFLRRSGVFVLEETTMPYVVFLVAGLVLWQTFVDALNAPLRMVAQSKAMLTKVNFPREALLLAGVAEVLLNFLIRAGLLAAVLLWYRQPPAPGALLAPFGVLALVAVGLAIGLLLVPLALLFQDVEHGLTLLVSLWMFATPVLYAPPTEYPASLTMVLNPISPVLDTARASLLGGTPVYLGPACWIMVATMGALLAGWVVYRLALPILIERIGA